MLVMEQAPNAFSGLANPCAKNSTGRLQEFTYLFIHPYITQPPLSVLESQISNSVLSKQYILDL